jgi:hypothetical protein
VVQVWRVRDGVLAAGCKHRVGKLWRRRRSSLGPLRGHALGRARRPRPHATWTWNTAPSTVCPRGHGWSWALATAAAASLLPSRDAAAATGPRQRRLARRTAPGAGKLAGAEPIVLVDEQRGEAAWEKSEAGYQLATLLPFSNTTPAPPDPQGPMMPGRGPPPGPMPGPYGLPHALPVVLHPHMAGAPMQPHHMPAQRFQAHPQGPTVPKKKRPIKPELEVRQPPPPDQPAARSLGLSYGPKRASARLLVSSFGGRRRELACFGTFAGEHSAHRLHQLLGRGSDW